MNRPVYSVSQVNAYIKQMFSRDEKLRYLSVSGEVSGCTYHSSGHLYFTIKDKMGQLSCVMFSSAVRNMTFQLEKGQSVVIYGNVQVFERDGRYQLYAERIEKEGVGLLFEQTEELKRRLEAEGLFAPERKKPIPSYVKTVGIVTAKTGAAIRDIVQIAGRRNPYVKLVLVPALVQGEGAPESIANAIRRLDAIGTDVMIVGRGGGSAEDLMAFNTELVVRAVAECQTPVISAVGHEVDIALTDFAADLRAPTPSAAAELAVYEYADFEESLVRYHVGLCYAMNQKIESARNRADRLYEKLLRVGPAGAVKEKRNHLTLLERKLKQGFQTKLVKRRHRLELLAGRLHAVSPAQRLSGGYAYVTREGAPLISVEGVAVSDRLNITVKDGSIQARVESVEQSGKE